MTADLYLLDTSALLTLIEDEAGADRVEEAIQSGRVIVPWLALLEVHYISQQERGTAEADRRYALIKELPVKIIWSADEAVLFAASGFKANHRLSLADAIMAAVAIQHKAILIHKDPEYQQLNGLVLLEALPYKTPLK